MEIFDRHEVAVRETKAKALQSSPTQHAISISASLSLLHSVTAAQPLLVCPFYVSISLFVFILLTTCEVFQPAGMVTFIITTLFDIFVWVYFVGSY